MDGKEVMFLTVETKPSLSRLKKPLKERQNCMVKTRTIVEIMTISHMIEEVQGMTIEVITNDPSQKSMKSIKHLSFNNNNPKKTQVSSWGDV
jgi:hypothetical protein